jgi:predicted cupin superfamily sugar epimerase
MYTAQQIIKSLGLLAHPEGGFYKETYRSEQTLKEENRQLLTSIYFLLTSDNVSHFHRIKSDELWYFHAGNPLIVHTLSSVGHQQHQLGLDLSKGEQPFLFIPKNTIFGSTVKDNDGFSLVSCAVAPGFDFRDFELFERAQLLADFPEHVSIIERLTT